MAGRGGKRNIMDPSDAAVVRITKAVENLQYEKDRSYRIRRSRLEANQNKQVYKEIVGGSIQGYEFSFEEGDKLSHGSLISECHSDADVTRHEATFLLLPKGERGMLAADRVFQSTSKMRGSDAIAAAYLVAECRKLNKWIICYEKLAGLLDDHSESVQPFYVNQNEVSPYWKAQLRAIFTTLADMGTREVCHGGMLDSTTYAVKAGSMNIKLIGLNKKQVDKGWDNIDDLHEFGAFLEKTEYIKATTSEDWEGFSFLMRSHAIRNIQKSGCRLEWTVLLNHPLLLESNFKSWSYMDVYEWTELISYSEKVQFCNDLFCLMPQYRKSRLWKLIKHCPDCCKIYAGDIYGRGWIYMDIIKFIRNMINHGKHKLHGIRTYDDIIRKIDSLFPGFMSIAYSVTKMSDKDRELLYEKTGRRNLPYH